MISITGRSEAGEWAAIFEVTNPMYPKFLNIVPERQAKTEVEKLLSLTEKMDPTNTVGSVSLIAVSLPVIVAGHWTRDKDAKV